MHESNTGQSCKIQDVLNLFSIFIGVFRLEIPKVSQSWELRYFYQNIKNILIRFFNQTINKYISSKTIILLLYIIRF